MSKEANNRESHPLTASEFRDEVSLRDLYVTFVRGLPLMMGVAFVFGLIAFGYSSFLPDTYQASSTALISPRPISVQGPSNVSFNPSSDVSFNAYETLAKSRTVLEDAAQTVADNSDLSADDALRTLRSSTLNEILGPVRSDIVAPLAITHSVISVDPLQTALLADAWATSSVNAVRDSLLASLDPVNQATLDEVDTLTLELTDTEARWRDFQAQDDGELLAARLAGITQQIADGESQLTTLERTIAAARGAVNNLNQQLDIDTLRRQLTRSETRLGNARDTLATFEADINLELLQAREDELSQTLAARESALVTLAADIAAETARRDDLADALQNQPEILVLREQLLDNPVLSALFDDLDVAALAGVTLERQEANPAYDTALDRFLEAQGRLAAFAGERDALTATITELQTRLEATRRARVTQESEQTRLLAAAEEAETAYRNAYQQISLAELAGEDSRVLLASSPAWRDFENNLRQQVVTLESALAEREQVVTQIAQLTQTAAALQQQIADLNQQRSRIERELTQAQNAYEDVATLQPMISFVTQLAPTNARVLSPASIPNQPVGPRRALNTALGIVVGGFLALLFVFFREAVRSPSETNDNTSAASVTA